MSTRASHFQNPSSTTPKSTTNMSQIEPNKSKAPILSIDVETIATGFTHVHSDRCPFQVAVVDSSGESLYSSYIQPDRAVVSYLTPLTGIKADDVDIKEAPTMKQVISKVQSFCSPSTILVGQYPKGDVKWMQLEQGKHYAQLIDIATWFQAKRKGKPIYFSLAHESNVLLGETQGDIHCPIRDAQLTMKLYHAYKNSTEAQLHHVRGRLMFAPRTSSVAHQHGYIYEGVCLAGFSRTHCTCGKPLHSD